MMNKAKILSMFLIIISPFRKMQCDCEPKEDEDGQGCGDDCANKMLMIECGKDCLLENKCGNKRYVFERAYLLVVRKGCGDNCAKNAYD